jgi:ribosome-binding ATPase
MQIGIVGLPNAGKSTLFNALTRAGAQIGNYAFTTIQPNHGIAPVPDDRLRALTAVYRPEKETPASVEFVDIAGLVKGASRGEGLGNQFLGHIRNVDAIVHVVRAFPNPDAPEEVPDPADDVQTILTELILADLQTVERQMEKAEKAFRTKGGAANRQALDDLQQVEAHLSAGHPARTLEGRERRKEIFLLTDKPVLYVANVEESDVTGGSPLGDQLRAGVPESEHLPEGTHVLEISARIESELVDLPDEEASEFMADLGIEEPGLNRLIRESYSMLGLISFFTVGEDECRAWSIPQGTRAQDAAAEIHTDIARGFIRAEVIAWNKLVECGGSWAAARERGWARLEGRDYLIQDGEVSHFRFQV